MTEEKQIRILHFIIHNSCPPKVHCMFKDTETAKHFFILPAYKANKAYSFLPTGTHIIKSPNKIVVSNYKKGMIDIEAYLNKVKPHLIIHSTPNLPPAPFTLLKKYAPVYFIPHGVSNRLALKMMINYRNSWSRFDGFFINSSEKYVFDEWAKKGMSRPTYIMNGLPQIDFMRSLDHVHLKKLIYKHIDPKTGDFSSNTVGLPLTKKSMLVLPTKDLANSRTEIKGATSLCNVLASYAKKHDMHIFFKMKHVGNIRRNPAFQRGLIADPNITLLPPEFYMYYFMFSDAIIVENYGTSIIEGFIHTPKSLLVCYNRKSDVSGIAAYPLLPQAYDNNELITWLDRLLSEKDYPTPESETQRKEFIKMNIGEPRENATDYIMDTIQMITHSSSS